MPDFNFDPTADDFTVVNAYAMVQMASLAYGSDAAIKKQLKTWGYQLTDVVEAEENQAFIAADDKSVIVAFRGTDNINNAFTDANCFLTGGPLGKVHDGFIRALSFLWVGVTEAIDTARGDADGPLSLWLTGHSLGGALATLAAARFLERGQPVHALYTYGCPRCGDETFEATFNSKFDRAFRFVYRNDIVTRVPPRIPLGYRHVGTVKHLDKDCQITGELQGWAAFLQKVEVTLKDMKNKDFNSVSDHHVANYVDCLQKNAEAGSA